jgi:hypothetical protein
MNFKVNEMDNPGRYRPSIASTDLLYDETAFNIGITPDWTEERRNSEDGPYYVTKEFFD